MGITFTVRCMLWKLFKISSFSFFVTNKTTGDRFFMYLYSFFLSFSLFYVMQNGIHRHRHRLASIQWYYHVACERGTRWNFCLWFNVNRLVITVIVAETWPTVKSHSHTRFYWCLQVQLLQLTLLIDISVCFLCCSINYRHQPNQCGIDSQKFL